MSLIWALLFICVLLILFLMRLQAYKDRTYFEQQGLLYLGNRSYDLFYHAVMGISARDALQGWYDLLKKKDKKVAGSKEFGANVFFITDPQILKNISIKDFEHFHNRREFDMPEEEVLFRKMLFSLRGKKWKSFRTKMSPAFTSGKIKRLFPLFEKSGDAMISYLHKQVKTSPEVNLTKAFNKFTLEIIATAVCGINSEAFDSDNSMFEEMSEKMKLSFGFTQVLKLLVVLVFPKVANIFNLTMFDKPAQEYFTWVVSKAIEMRKEQGGDDKQDNFIQLMLEARKDEGLDKDEFQQEFLEDEYIIANCVLFILAGSDTTQSALIFMAYAIALDEGIQDKLRKEIEEAVEKDEEKVEGQLLSYDKLNNLPYMDMVLNETLRLYAPTVMVDRGCTEDYKIPETDIVIRKGQGVLIPILAIHHDERFYENPKTFDPERWSPENKSKIDPSTFLPFGSGPRGCIGYRFAKTEAKLAIALTLYNFKLEPSKNTPIPMKYQNHTMLRPKDDLMLNVTRIQRPSKTKP